MAKLYRAKRDVSIPKPVGLLDPANPDGDWVTEGATYPAGSIISEEWITPRDRKRAENGDLDHLLESVGEGEAPEGYVIEGGFNEPEHGVFIAEHEAERTALEAGGHVVVPDEQKMEMLSASLPHAKGYMEAVKEHGLDRRPALEFLQQPRPRVPDEALYGAETNAGLPHNRGNDESWDKNLDEHRERAREATEEAKSDVDNDVEGSSRPAPGSASNSEQQQNDEGGGRQEAEPQTVS